MEHLIIREPKPEEYQAVVDLTNTAFNAPTEFDTFRGAYNEPYELFIEKVTKGIWHVLVAILDDTIVGAVRYQFPPEEEDLIWMFKLAVLPAYRKRGIAPALMRQVEEFGKKRGYVRIGIEAMEEKGLPEYYKKFGFTADLVKENHGHHDIIMTKSLK